MSGRCRSCPRQGSRCESCRERDKRNQINHRVRMGEIPLLRCFRCKTVHPWGDKGERYCFLASEFNGWPWLKEDALREDAA